MQFSMHKKSVSHLCIIVESRMKFCPNRCPTYVTSDYWHLRKQKIFILDDVISKRLVLIHYNIAYLHLSIPINDSLT